MSRYPFNDRIEEFLGTGSDSSNDQLSSTDRNHLHNIGRILHLLKENGAIQSDNPSRITPKDIQCFIEERRSEGVSESTISRDLSYLDSYLCFHDNCSVREYLEDLRVRNLEEKKENSKKALRKIFLHNSKDIKGGHLVKAYAFVMLAIVFDIHPDMLRRAMLRNAFENGCVNNYRIRFIDRRGMEKDELLDLNRLPVIGRYIDQTYLLGFVNSTPRPIFPSSNPLFDYISPDESRELKHQVEEDIGISFDYTQCTEIYFDMLEDDSPFQRSKLAFKGIQTLPVRRRSLFDRLLGR
ncbi:MAG: site-specific integrase [Candidatus Methanomethylophilaceae archaeon]|nr:site-specific integrase [Candidatus Methanomethylophilaceae archaeon]